MKETLLELIEHRPLDRATAREVLVNLASGKFNSSQVSAFLTVYMMRTITLDELAGFRDAMLELCIPVETDRPVMDVCGTGGDGKNTFNISTLSAFVVAAAGQPVAKHGNYGVSSVSGSSNVLEYFGYRFTNNPDHLRHSLDELNLLFMHAPLFHPAMKNVAPVRKELGIKTFFNMLGPMVNPARPGRQLVGVFSLELARLYAYLYQNSGSVFLVLHDLAGYDEISLTGNWKIYTQEGERVLSPSDIGIGRIDPSAITAGTSVEESASIFLSVLECRGTQEQTNVVVANAGMALYAADPDRPLDECMALAREALISGKALGAFRKLLDLKP
jgi:anthranilate phosphoribosyltransferase